MKTLLLHFLLVILINMQLPGQDLHIFYNAQTEALRYDFKGKTVTQPKVVKSSNIFLHVQNYNNYLYDVVVNFNEQEIRVLESSAAGMLTNLLPQGGANPFMLFSPRGLTESTNDGPMFDMDLTDESPIFSPSGIKGFGKNEEEAAENTKSESLNKETLKKVAQVKIELSQAKERLNLLETDISALQMEINRELEANQVQYILFEEVEKVKHNPQLKPNQIKKISEEYLSGFFNVKSIEEIDLSYVLERKPW